MVVVCLCVTLNGCRVSVCAHVSLEVAGLCEALLANLALVWPLSGVCADVRMHTAGLGECHPADVARERLLARVDALVPHSFPP